VAEGGLRHIHWLPRDGSCEFVIALTDEAKMDKFPSQFWSGTKRDDVCVVD